MIFVTVGTHEQQFDRLIKYMDKLVADGEITEDVIMQTGYSTYIPKYCTWKNVYPYQEMISFIKEANIVVTHGGPSSFIAPLQMGKTPVVVPRQFQYAEHVNDHQVEFVKEVSERMGNIIAIYDIDNLKSVINNYAEIVAGLRKDSVCNNERFNHEFKIIVDELFASK